MENTFTRTTKNAAEILAGVKAGGTMFVRTYGHNTKIDSKAVARFEKAGAFLLGDETGNFRMAAGRKSVYVYRENVWLNF